MGESKKFKRKVNNIFGEQVWEDQKYSLIDHPWDTWDNMPSYDPTTPALKAYSTIRVNFDSVESREAFSKLTGIKILEKTLSNWFYKTPPPEKTGRWFYVSDNPLQPKYPIYLPSKGRWDVRHTSDTLIRMGVKHNMVVEESQYENYKAAVDPNWVTLLILPQKYLDEYDTMDDLGATRSKGPGAARNFAWDHSKAAGFKRHWVMDDNMKDFYRLDEGRRIRVADGSIIRAMEDHTDRYKNVHMSGPQYRFFARGGENPPVVLNSRIYSCNLILNESPFRWRGRYNEDTILSLDMLSAGHCTLQYFAFLSGKLATQTVKGGNTAEFYAKEGTLPKSKMLQDAYPEVSTVTWRYGRWHHHVDYSPFRANRLIPEDNPWINPDPDYGMKLVLKQKGEYFE